VAVAAGAVVGVMPTGCRGSASSESRRPGIRIPGRAGQCESGYLRAAQAYMLISMPTGTSTIFGAFQAIHLSRVQGANTQGRQITFLRRGAQACDGRAPLPFRKRTVLPWRDGRSSPSRHVGIVPQVG
jgi:hypothetical protein